MENKGRFVDCGKLFRLTVPAARGAVILSLNREHGVTQSDIAKMLGITQPAVSKYLNAGQSNKITTLEKLIMKKKLQKEAVRRALSGERMLEHQIDLIASDRSIIEEAAKL